MMSYKDLSIYNLDPFMQCYTALFNNFFLFYFNYWVTLHILQKEKKEEKNYKCLRDLYCICVCVQQYSYVTCYI